ncbi:aromatic ring-hydroxylating dioxygenase subunit alpha [aff. Roholtiella sp. LEGE 12411]|uniref:aromatic ring-hydroxylating dioxygenase subunit alpha n=1 Tax=aff. Roholtiella sp. LEGE 12411 TaxID=1828822 RepID=UPI0018812A31|nr:aromatic ring-hydroxylating dioxygenase subunit alpha [aff. Roholtiella sp. LEGE 12411]MBE9035037.1 aromatic ring-hydroxylating dioxygenase subunit alpha [aff. Roholtiella sp. LEGE 12411]
MLKNFWYACELSSAITSKPKRVTMLNQEFVLYRNSQKEVVALNDVCPHRGAALSNGWVEDDCIRCPYHGWKYQADGTCIKIPANQPGVPIPKRARIDTYPVQEKYGFVWLFWGDIPEKERPPLPSLPEFGAPGWRAVYGQLHWNTHYTRVLENAIDISHVPFIHVNSIGSGIADQPRIEEYDVSIGEWSGSATVTASQSNKTKGFWKTILSKQGSRPLSVTLSFYMPNISRLEFGFSIGHFRIILFIIHVPIDDRTTMSKWIVLRNFITVPLADGDARKRALKTMLEDKPIIESQNPKIIPNDLTSELHAPSDNLSIAYRKLRKKCLDMGWGMESHLSQSDYTNSHVAEPSQDLAIAKVF